MRKIRFPVNHFLKIKNIVCLILILVLLFTSVSSVVLAEGEAAATEEPAATEEAEATEEPAATEEATATEEPAATEDVAATEEPAATEETAATEEPEATEDTETTEVEEESVELGADANSISGMVWKDTDKNGTYNSGEQPITGYHVYLYKEGDLSVDVETKVTDANGKYEFADIEPGSYVVGVRGEDVDGVDYLAPIIGVREDNKFNKADSLTEYTAISDRIEIAEGMVEDVEGTDGTVEYAVVTDINAGMRTFSTRMSPMMRSWSGDGTQTNPYLITNEQDLRDLATSVNGGNNYTGNYFELTADIDLNNVVWTPIGYGGRELLYSHFKGSTDDPLNSTLTRSFEGIFNGNNKVIRGLTVLKTGTVNTTSGVDDYNGLFGFVRNAQLLNIIIDGASITGQSGTGALVGYSRDSVVIRGCVVRNSTVTSRNIGGNYGTGGIAGDVRYYNDAVVVIEDCKVEDTTVTGGSHYGRTGGMIGIVNSYYSESGTSVRNVNAAFTMINCSVTGGSVNRDNSSGASTYMGGLIGMIHHAGSGDNTARVESCIADIPVRGTNSVGGLIGQIWDSMGTYGNHTQIVDCHAYGTVTSTLGYAGGLIGFVENYLNNSQWNDQIIDGCSAAGNLTSSLYYNGGLVGHIHNGVVIKNSWATGNVTSTSYSNGGLVGWSCAGGVASGGYQCTIINSYATGHVKGGTFTGGLVGANWDGNIKNSYATGSVNGTSASSGGLIGQQYGRTPYYTTIENCYATGTVLSGNGGFMGNYAGSGSSRTTITNCFYDTTTTKKTASQAVSGLAGAGVTALTTGKELNNANGMINIESFSVWNIKNNINGKANGAGDESTPWYIDDKITYPYLWYQFDGHTKEEVDYNLGTAKYSFTSGSVTDKHIAPRRADFLLSGATTNQATYYNVKTSGAKEVYFPYLAQNFVFKGQKEIRVPESGSHTVANATTPYSLGGMSATDIISFDPLPYAEKTSDRAEYQEGVESTYTIRGDLVEYKVTITNPSIRYEWLDVVLTDPLPKGVTLVEGMYNGQNYNVTVKVSDGDAAAIPKDASDADIGPCYYTYKKAMNDSETDEPLKVYLGDFQTAKELTDGGIELYTVEVTFTAVIDRRAVSQFPLNDPQNIIENGDNIRNTGIVDGTIREVEDHSNTFPYESDFDDENADPVYDSYKVSYIGNGGKIELGDVKYDEYYLYDKNFSVNDNDGTPFQFSWVYHLFMGEWHSRAKITDGPTVIYDIGSAHGLLSNKNPVASGYRDDADEEDDIYDDYYALTDFKLYAPWKEQTGSIKVIKEDEEGEPLPGARFLLEKQDGTDWIPLKWDAVAKEWITMLSGETYTGETDSSGKLILGKNGTDNTLQFGTYRLTEVKSPNGYSLLKEPIMIEMPYEKIAVSDPSDEWDIKYVNGDGDTVYTYFNLTYTVTNVGVFDLPESGNAGIPWYIYYIGAVVFAVVVSYICVISATDTKNINKTKKQKH